MLIGCTGQAALFASWGIRFPSEAHHDMSVWDNLIATRKTVIHALREAFPKAPSIESDERSQLLTAFDWDANSCLMATYQAAARAARRQGNFGTAISYAHCLKDVRQALGMSAALGSKVELLVLRREKAWARSSWAAGPAAAGGDDTTCMMAPIVKELKGVYDAAERIAADPQSGMAEERDRWELSRLRATVRVCEQDVGEHAVLGGCCLGGYNWWGMPLGEECFSRVDVVGGRCRWVGIPLHL